MIRNSYNYRFNFSNDVAVKRYEPAELIKIVILDDRVLKKATISKMNMMIGSDL
jgi:hypothetical protein